MKVSLLELSSARSDARPGAPGVEPKAGDIDALISLSPNAHFTQHPGWALVPSGDDGGRRLRFVGEDAGGPVVAALLHVRAVPLAGLPLVDVFRGPAARSAHVLLEGLAHMLKAIAPMRPTAVRVDPYWSGEGSDFVRRGLGELGFAPMADPPWHVRSLEIPIDCSEEALIGSFKSPTRRQVRKALKQELDVREDLDDAGLAAFQALYEQMSARKGASPRSAAFFRGIRDMMRAWPSRGFFLSSWHQSELLGAISVFTLGRRAIYAYGATSTAHPDLPKSHLLHFEAMRRAGARGCTVYDMGGFAQGVGEEGRRTPAQKVNFFKSGFGGAPIDFVAGHEMILRPALFRLLRAARSLGRRQAQREAAPHDGGAARPDSQMS